MGLGSAGAAGLVMSGTEAVTACSCEACAGDADAGFTVWASALKFKEECGPTCHAAAAKKTQEIPVTIRAEERRKRILRTLLGCDSSWAWCGVLVTPGVTRVAGGDREAILKVRTCLAFGENSGLPGFVLGVARLRLCETGEGARRHMGGLGASVFLIFHSGAVLFLPWMVQSISLWVCAVLGCGGANCRSGELNLGGCGGCWR